jgi:hypothetical protein
MALLAADRRRALGERPANSRALAILPDRNALTSALSARSPAISCRWPMTAGPPRATSTRPRSRYVLTAEGESSANANRSARSAREPSYHSIITIAPTLGRASFAWLLIQPNRCRSRTHSNRALGTGAA